ncbi:ImpA family type VI secretion system protein [Jannaschia sp. CCS1]|uniref:type VI secretion system protein TssA n=1 Tax=Jannaschia sp. (strain CCS1) TaxID=290400 RepID=UPI0002E4B632|nr:type VI secretion system ImpA family N-terminal domain-containing protein [Jannaschia sp. CCS1]
MPDASHTANNDGSVGENPRETDRAIAEYRRLRDARSAARAEERKQETAEARDRALKVAPDWTIVRDLARFLLDEVGRDIEVAVWLIEAETRLDGFDGLARAAEQLADMINAHGMALHPQPEDALDRPFDMIAGLNGIGREGTLIQPLRLVPLVAEGDYGQQGLWNVTDGGGAASVAAALATSGTEQISHHLNGVDRARRAVARCDTALTALLGPDAPPFNKIDESLEDAAAAIRNLAGHLLTSEPDENTADATGLGEDPPTTSATTQVMGKISSRDEAFAQMLRIAAYFRKTEPHSPIADTLETLVRRGRMDFVTLLTELIPDDHARQAVMTTAGIGSKPPTSETEG